VTKEWYNEICECQGFVCVLYCEIKRERERKKKKDREKERKIKILKNI
jgi:hypothetical protein